MAEKHGISYYTVKDLYEELGKIVNTRGDCPILIPNPYRDEYDVDYILMGYVDDMDRSSKYIYFENVPLEDDIFHYNMEQMTKWKCPCCGSNMQYIEHDNAKIYLVCKECERHIDIQMTY